MYMFMHAYMYTSRCVYAEEKESFDVSPSRILRKSWILVTEDSIELCEFMLDSPC
jgi:hypothetical protein